LAVLKKQLGFSDALAIGIGATFGPGIFILFGVAVGYAGPSVIFSFIFTTIATALCALCHAELGSMFPKSGGPYVFVKEGFGNFIGFLVGWNSLLALVAWGGLTALGFVEYLSYFIPTPRVLTAVLAIVAFTILNYVGVRLVGRTQIALTFLGTSALLLLISVGISRVNLTLYSPMFPNGVVGMFQASLIVFLAFLGFEAITSVGEEIKNPEKNLPRSILLTLIVIAAIYVALALIAVGTTPWKAIAISEAPLTFVANALIPGIGAAYVAACGMLMCLAIMNVCVLFCSRMAFAMAIGGAFPAQLVKTHPKFGTPANAILLFGAIMALTLIVSNIDFLASVAGIIWVIIYALINLSLIPLRRRKTPNLGFKVPLYPVTPILGAILLLPLLVKSDLYSCAIVLLWTGIGLIYCFVNK